MVLCDNDCVPCCDFCIHCEHEWGEGTGGGSRHGPIGCKLHKEQEYQDKAEGCGSCDDYYCFLAAKDTIGERVEVIKRTDGVYDVYLILKNGRTWWLFSRVNADNVFSELSKMGIISINWRDEEI